MVPVLRSGELATRPLPGLLLDLHDGGVNGCLTLRRAGMVKSIDLADGELVRVTSSLRDETLGHFLVQRGAITERQHRDALDRAAPAKSRLGETLVALGALTGEALRRHVIEQDRQKVVSALRWPHGTWRFDVQAAAQRPAEGLWMPEIVVRGLYTTGEHALDRLGRIEGASVELTARGRAMTSLLRTVFGAALADALARGGPLASLAALCGDRSTLARAVEALLLCGAANVHRAVLGASIERSAPAVAQGEAALPRGVAPRRSDPALGSVAATATRAVTEARALPAGAARSLEAATPAASSSGERTARPSPSELGSAPTTSSRAPTRRELWSVRPPGGEAPAAVPRTVTNAARSRTWTPWASLAARTETNPLYELLFDEEQNPSADGSAPLEVSDEDSGVISMAEIGAVKEHGEAAAAASAALIAEAERVRNADLYTVLLLARTATNEQIAAALARCHAALTHHLRLLPAGAHPRSEEVRAVYESARAILLDEDARRSYDHALQEAEAQAPALDAELLFAGIEDLLVAHRYAEAILRLQQLVARAPSQADYHEALGWAHWLHKGPSQQAGELARPHLGRALQLEPDHVAAHVHRGIIGAALGEDDAEVVFHLERTLELRPARADALEHLLPILLRRGELRRIERLYKRLLFRLSASYPRRTVELWLGLAQLYAYHLDDAAASESAAANALALAGSDATVLAAVERIRAVCQRPLYPLEPARARLRRTGDLASASALIESAREAGQPDAAFLTAATMVALGQGDAKMRHEYERHRVQRPALASQRLTEAEWELLRDPEDLPELATLMELIAPAIAELSPITLRSAAVDVAMRVSDSELPAAFRRTRDLLATIFAVDPPAVYARPELDRQIQLVAVDPPILVAGDEALTAPERPELVCRLARAMCHAHGGRVVGGSRSGAVLRAAMLAVLRDATAGTVGEEDELATAASAAIKRLAPGTRKDARAEARRLLARHSAVNLSRWSRSLARTADRAGVALCQDIPTALAVMKESGVLDRSLVEFAYGPEHVALRTSLGLSVCR